MHNFPLSSIIGDITFFFKWTRFVQRRNTWVSYENICRANILNENFTIKLQFTKRLTKKLILKRDNTIVYPKATSGMAQPLSITMNTLTKKLLTLAQIDMVVHQILEISAVQFDSDAWSRK